MQDPEGFVYVLGSSSVASRQKEFKKVVEIHALSHQRKKLLDSEKRQIFFMGLSGPVWIIQAGLVKKGQHAGLLDESDYAWFRDQS